MEDHTRDVTYYCMLSGYNVAKVKMVASNVSILDIHVFYYGCTMYSSTILASGTSWLYRSLAVC